MEKVIAGACAALLAVLIVAQAGQAAPVRRTEKSSNYAKTTSKTPQMLRAEIEALKAPHVAWRQIQWKSCLLDGIRESRAQKKPIMLWIFIDRPTDDERC